MGTLTRQQLYFVSLDYKAKKVDKDFKDTIKARDRAMTCRSDDPPLTEVTQGRHHTYDVREKPDIAGFPKGDKRRW